MEEDLDQLVGLYRDNWAYVAEKQKQTGHSLDDLHHMALAELDKVWTWQDFAGIVTRFVSRLEDGHSWVVPTTVGSSNQKAYLLPFRLRETREGLVVSEVMGSGSGLKVGDLLVGLDDKPMSKLVEEGVSSTFVSCDSARVHQVVHQLNTSRKSQVVVTGERDGHDFSTEVKGSLLTDSNYLAESPWISSEKLQPDAGLVRIKTFYPDRAERMALDKRNAPDSDWEKLNQKARKELETAMTAVQDCRTIIIDLRDNGGGTDAIGRAVASYFLPPGSIYYSLQWRNCPFIRAHHADLDFRHLPTDIKGDWYPVSVDQLSEKAPHPLYDKQVILITDEGCFSATSDFISAMKADNPHVRIVGRPENAGAGGPRQLGTLKHSEIQIWGSTCRVYRPDGNLLEGNPVMPDVPVEWTRDDVVKGCDPDVAAALDLAGKSDW
jgi:C-terminal processing protease CtpA/Prc